MSNAGDFVIENGVLTEYRGQGGDIVIPDGVTKIGRSAFANRKDLKSITIPGSAKNIAGYVFSNCENLASVVMEDGVETIGSGVFEGCGNLISVTIPGSVKRMKVDTFDWSIFSFDRPTEEFFVIFAPAGSYAERYAQRQDIPYQKPIDIPFDKGEVIIPGKTFVLTGFFRGYAERSEVKEMIIAKGGRCTTTVSGKTDYLVTGQLGDWGDRKLADLKVQRAKGAPVKLISQASLFDALNK